MGVRRQPPLPAGNHPASAAVSAQDLLGHLGPSTCAVPPAMANIRASRRSAPSGFPAVAGGAPDLQRRLVTSMAVSAAITLAWAAASRSGKPARPGAAGGRQTSARAASSLIDISASIQPGPGIRRSAGRTGAAPGHSRAHGHRPRRRCRAPPLRRRPAGRYRHPSAGRSRGRSPPAGRSTMASGTTNPETDFRLRHAPQPHEGMRRWMTSPAGSRSPLRTTRKPPMPRSRHPRRPGRRSGAGGRRRRR